MPIDYRQPVASAQVKSAILLAGMHAAGRTTVIEPARSRDHTERLLAHLGAEITTDVTPEGGCAITVTGQPELSAGAFQIPADPSSAAFVLAAAALGQGSAVRMAGIGVNPLRTGFLTCLQEMGAALRMGEVEAPSGEPLASLEMAGSTLRGIEVPAARAPSMIDEYPILAIAAACARGVTTMSGLAELRVKESDRLAAIAEGLVACGVRVEVGEDSLTIHGCGGPPRGGAVIAARHDHRIAMSFLVLGGAAQAPVTVEGAETIETSFPGFRDLMNRLGAQIEMLEP